MQAALARADRALASAPLLWNAGDPDRAVSTAYYAMFYAARAALLHVDQAERAMGKTHAGMVSASGLFVVQAGLIDAAHGKAFAYQLHRRLIADYDAGGMVEDDVTRAIDAANSFVAAVRGLVQGA